MIAVDRYLHCLFRAAVLLLIVTPAAANIPTKGILSVFIIENEGPVTSGDLNYTIDCSIIPSYHASSYDSFERGDYSNPWAFFFTLTGTCPSGNCSPLTKMTWYHGRTTEEPTFICELNGSRGNETFSVWNTTGTRRYNLEDLYDIQVTVNGTSGFYNFTPEYLECNRNVMQPITVRKYPCEVYLRQYHRGDPGENITQTDCAGIYNREIPRCYPLLEKVNLSWTHNEPAIYYYSFHLPPGREPVDTLDRSPRYIPRSPVESLYCGLLNFFGVEC